MRGQRIKVPGNVPDLVMRIIGIAALAAVTVFVIVMWKRIPDVVPSHFNFRGQIDGYSGKKMILFPLVIGWGIFGMVNLLSAIPQAWNVPVQLTAENMGRILRTLKTMLLLIGMIVALFLAYMTFIMARGQGMAPAALALFLVAVVLSTAVCTTRVFLQR